MTSYLLSLKSEAFYSSKGVFHKTERFNINFFADVFMKMPL